MHVFMCLVSLFTTGLLPLEIFKVPYLPYYLMDFDQIKRRINSLKVFYNGISTLSLNRRAILAL